MEFLGHWPDFAFVEGFDEMEYLFAVGLLAFSPFLFGELSQAVGKHFEVVDLGLDFGLEIYPRHLSLGGSSCFLFCVQADHAAKVFGLGRFFDFGML